MDFDTIFEDVDEIKLALKNRLGEDVESKLDLNDMFQQVEKIGGYLNIRSGSNTKKLKIFPA